MIGAGDGSSHLLQECIASAATAVSFETTPVFLSGGAEASSSNKNEDHRDEQGACVIISGYITSFYRGNTYQIQKT